MVRTSRFDAAEYLDSAEAVAEFINAALETGDPSFISKSLSTVARARGMTDVARAAGLSRENLYRSLNGETRPEFGTILRVLEALGVKLHAEPIDTNDDAHPHGKKQLLRAT